MTITAEKQLKVLGRIWTNARVGYVFLPWIPAAQARTSSRKEAWQEDKAFAWPADKAGILEHLKKHLNDDLYFAPTVFSQPMRRSEYAVDGSRLYADLDHVDPYGIEEELKPTYAWETSPDRYAAIWRLPRTVDNITAPGGLNHRLTQYLGADPSGWDTTQLLRVPGSANNKPDKPSGTRGKLLWEERGITPIELVEEICPAIEVKTFDSDLDEQLLEGVDRFAVYVRVKKRIKKNVREFLRMKDTEGLDRSGVLWQIERELADAGCTLAEIVALVRPTVWNKFAGRQDELKRLMIEGSKAIAERATSENVFDEAEVPKPGKLVPFWQDTEYLNAKEPDWLVPGVIPEGGCGMIAGIPKSMKSWIALDLAVSLTTGKPWLGYDIPEAVNVLYIQEEDPPTLVKKRHHIIASGKSPEYAIHTGHTVRAYPKNLYVQVYKQFRGNDEGWQTWLGDVIAEHQISLVIMDTLATIAPDVDVMSGSDVKAQLLDPMKQIARATHAAICIVHHMTKASDKGRSGQNMAGSGQIHAWTDFFLGIKNKEEFPNGSAILHCDIETKYTGTVSPRYQIADLDNDIWQPELMLEEDGMVHEFTSDPSRTKKGFTVSLEFMKQQVGSLIKVDPLVVDVEVTDKTKYTRAWIKKLHEEGRSIEEIVEETTLSEGTVKKCLTYLGRDYAHIIV